MQLLTVILSSAVISSIVTVILSYVFENKRYIKDKKISIYTEFLEQLDKMFPAEEIFGDAQKEQLLQKMKIEASRLEKYVWKIKLISQSGAINDYADQLFETSEKLIEELSLEGNDEKLESIIDESNELTEKLIKEMGRDVGRF